MKIINKINTNKFNLIQIIKGNKKKSIGEIIFLNARKKFYFVLPYYNLYVFKSKIIAKIFENTYAYNESDILYDNHLELKIEKNLSFITSIKYIKQKKSHAVEEYKKSNILKNLRYCILVPFSNMLSLKDNACFLSNRVDYKLKTNILKKSGFTLSEIKKIFL